MAEPESRSEEPTEHRLVEARRRGVIPVSRDFQSALVAFAICLAMVLSGRTWFAGLLGYLRNSWAQACSRDHLAGAGHLAALALIGALKIPLGIAVVVTLMGGVALTRGLFAPHAFRFDLGRILPSSRRRDGVDRVGEMAKTLAQTTMVILLAWWTIRPCAAGVVHLGGAGAGKTLAVFGAMAESLGLRLAVAAVTLGVADYFWQRYRHRRSLRMTREQVKREQKEREGDPLWKSERERLRDDFLRQQGLNEVRRATLVVVDGERRAVALRYHPAEDRAPVVVCKGERLMAIKIMQMARDVDVPIGHDQALTEVLAGVEEGSEIPDVSHEAVARLLVAARD
jgi:flagellar biosynthesis protein FlhB